MLGLPDVAEHFQGAGITALVYDPRSTGLSDGHPRNEIDPSKQVEDYSDALTFLSTLPSVDPSQIGFWGMSFAGTVSLCAASLDKRAKFVVAVCPLTELEYTPEKLPKVLVKCMKDRESQAMGNSPFYLPMLTEKGENPAGFGTGIDKERYAKIVNAGKEIAPNHVNRTTLQSYYKMVMWQPFTLWRHLNSTPVMFIVPELDKLSPAETQLHHFGNLTGPKRSHIEPGVGHMEILDGENLPSLMKLQIRFVCDALLGKVT
jgi:pimeloyl-ACP methyl ester carboxylesterase